MRVSALEVVTYPSENLEICSPIGHSDHAILKYSIIINPATIKREQLVYFSFFEKTTYCCRTRRLSVRLSSGVARGGQGGGICPRAPPGGGRQNPAKDLKKII